MDSRFSSRFQIEDRWSARPRSYSNLESIYSKEEKILLTFSSGTLVFLLVSLIIVMTRPQCNDRHRDIIPAEPPLMPCAGKCNELVPDLKNCSRYYKCENGMHTSMSCERDHLFNVKASACQQKNKKDSEKSNNLCASKIEFLKKELKRMVSSAVFKGGENKHNFELGNKAHCKRIICYVTIRGTGYNYINGVSGTQLVYDFDPMLCTHLIYSYAVINNTRNTIHAYSTHAESMYPLLMDKKRTNPSLKVLLSVGGPEVGSMPFSTMAASPDSRREFIKNALNYIDRFEFDGIDLHWEFPGIGEGSSPRDKDAFLDLLIEVRGEISKRHARNAARKYIFSVLVGAAKDIVDTSYYVPSVNVQADLINLKTYGFYGPTDTGKGVRHPSALMTADTLWDVNSAVETWISKGASRDKMNLGMQFNAVTFKFQNDNGCLNITGPGMKGKYTKRVGYLAYYEVCELLFGGNNEWKAAARPTTDELSGPSGIKANEYIGYEDRASIEIKSKYALLNQLGGVMAWDVTADDFTGQVCSSSSSRSSQTHTNKNNDSNPQTVDQLGKYPLLMEMRQSCNMPTLF